MSALYLRNATLADGRACDVEVHAGTIVAVHTHEHGAAAPRAAAAGADQDVDLGGRVLIPSLVNGHAHLDKTFLGASWQSHLPGATVRARVSAEREMRRTVGVPIAERAETLARLMIEQGTGLLRTHVDVDGELGLDAFDAVDDVRRRLLGLIDVQIVAFPQSGILHERGVREHLARALEGGADVVGGLDPWGFDRDPRAHLDVVFALAGEYGRGVDIHLHDLGAEGLRQMRDIAARTVAAGLQGSVVISHAYGLGSVPLAEALRVGDHLAAAGVAVMTNGPAGPMPPVLALRDIGVTVFSGSDNIRDAWWPFGTADMLDTARTVAYQSGFYSDEDLAVALDLVTVAAADALGVQGRTITQGAVADLVVLDTTTPSEAVVAPPARWLVLKHGVRVAGVAPAAVGASDTAIPQTFTSAQHVPTMSTQGAASS